MHIFIHAYIYKLIDFKGRGSNAHSAQEYGVLEGYEQLSINLSIFCVAFPEPMFHPTKTKDILVVPMRKMYHKENLWRRHRDIDGWEYWRMDGGQWLKILLINKNLVGSSWDGSYTLSAGADRVLFCLIFINVYSSYLTSVLFSWFNFFTPHLAANLRSQPPTEMIFWETWNHGSMKKYGSCSLFFGTQEVIATLLFQEK